MSFNANGGTFASTHCIDPALARVGIDAWVVAGHHVTIRSTLSDGGGAAVPVPCLTHGRWLARLAERLSALSGVVAVDEPTSRWTAPAPVTGRDPARRPAYRERSMASVSPTSSTRRVHAGLGYLSSCHHWALSVGRNWRCAAGAGHRWQPCTATTDLVGAGALADV